MDETGDHSYSPTATGVGDRYLGITGVAFFQGESYLRFGRQLEELKQRFCADHDPDDGPIILHRKEIVGATGSFTGLGLPEVRAQFNEQLLELLRATDFRWITVVVDKVSHMQKSHYRDLQHPYHYGLHVMLERYCHLLGVADETGDVLAEARGKEEDNELRQAYRDVRSYGTVGGYLSSEEAQSRLTSKEIKIKRKETNVAGLQLADLLAHPLTREVLYAHGKGDALRGFGGEVCKVVDSKCLRRNGATGGMGLGFGRKLLS